MTKKKRMLSLLAAVVALFVVLYSNIYIVVEADHECVGDNCPICCQINACQNTLKHLDLGVHTAATAAVFVYMICSGVSISAYFIQHYTLVSLKVKLSN